MNPSMLNAPLLTTAPSRAVVVVRVVVVVVRVVVVVGNAP
ncbi:ilvB operon leader peptide IvbL [Salmonella enterica]|nr:ilvB operon leader peptide IvbL [Salmonella enterica]EHV4619372.1 ilvB operon leader peptide IvbL [Salmonella enterica]EHV4628565.1 ilvB operon leader peptide IvbL [Salmonella enterica]EHV4637464.1 ilvB operon leader peptide IvbL [Salmonella enterica]